MNEGNEERVIRISKPKNVGGKVGVKISWIGYYPRPLPMLVGGEDFEIENIDKLELAPPKDYLKMLEAEYLKMTHLWEEAVDRYNARPDNSLIESGLASLVDVRSGMRDGLAKAISLYKR